jgi:class 3 adenylate cyclase
MMSQTCKPEKFDAVTIYFSDIHNYTVLCEQSKPNEIVEFLDDLYTLFDTICNKYETYKVSLRFF